ncbi:caspase family protein [Bradyrhizobium sp. INPA01-394B]|uniref:Caspase family protein n=1 Tax=Bradyrhizobium campsiandrae TaxID=1729892 RepID=A0ABR7TZV1_9BRAD|nr:caspase family protein [Bradyrhizobium campsiandrae]MBC9877436.1 caspase family protein [Bradyrhizobium campsiandrae]MBC9976845.1 caspase family protein [Bradyrhizobium campsiandrae]
MFRLKSTLMITGLLGSLFGFACGPVSAQVAPVEPAPTALQGPEQRVALVIGNSNYKNAPQLANPDNDAQSMAQFLNSAGFEVISATDVGQNDMLRVVQDFSAKVSARGPNTVAMVYYAGHGVQLAGENYLVPVDAKVSNQTELVNDSVRLVDVMSTLETIPSRMRIVILDACRNNPFPNVNDAGRGLAIVDAPNGSIVGYSTAPGAEALDGTNGHSPYTQAFLNIARQPNVPIEQLFKRVRLEVNQTTSGAQVPWESSSLTSDFTFFGDTAVAANRAPVNTPVVQMASNLPSRSARQAYDYVLSEGRPEYYQEFVAMYPHDPLCDHIRWLLANLLITQAWHQAVLANSPIAYKAFYDSYGNSPYAQIAHKLEAQPKLIPLMQATKFLAPQNIAPTLKIGNLGQPKYMPLIQHGQQSNGGSPMNANLPVVQKPVDSTVSKIVTLPAPTNTTTNNGGIGKIVTLPATNTAQNNGNNNAGTGKVVSMPVSVGKGGSTVDAKPVVQTQSNPIRINNGVKLNNTPVNKVQVQNNVQNNRPQFNTVVRTSNGGGNNFRQSMNQSQGMGGGNHRSFMH